MQEATTYYMKTLRQKVSNESTVSNIWSSQSVSNLKNIECMLLNIIFMHHVCCDSLTSLHNSNAQTSIVCEIVANNFDSEKTTLKTLSSLEFFQSM
jgi:hypothetical protein